MIKIITFLSKSLTFVYPVAVIIILALNVVPDNILEDAFQVSFSSQFSEVLFYTATTLSAGYYGALFIFSYLANYRDLTEFFKYLVFLKSLTGALFMITSFNSTYAVLLFGLLDILLAGMYFIQYKNARVSAVIG